MRFERTVLPGVVLVHQERQHDDRGWFGRSWCAAEFAAAGLAGSLAQTNLSQTAQAGTIRGLHWQAPPHAEAKLVRCLRGSIWDVVVDLRAGTPTFRRWAAWTLDPDDGTAVYVPPGCAHGFQTLVDDVLVGYAMSVPYESSAVRGLRYDDAALAIRWPRPAGAVSDRDLAWPPLEQRGADPLTDRSAAARAARGHRAAPPSAPGR